MRISLCVICGNEEAVIGRFLDSFAPCFDELSLCRAVGASPPDKTAEIARRWCQDAGKAYVFSEYRNRPNASELYHIDDFGAARNTAFENGTGDWLVWADCDDLIDQPEELRRVLSRPECGDLVRFDYDVIGTNKKPKRERAIRRSIFAAGNRWQFAVHENLLVAPGTPIGDYATPVWIHQPRINGTENRRRNKAILSRTLVNASANYFYVHQEWFCEGERINAQRFGELALAFPDLDPSFRYETNLNLARIAADNRAALRHALDAHSVFPWCREAMALIALIFMEREDGARALHWAQRLNETPLPSEEKRPWTHEPKWYGWAARDVLARCQRIAGEHTAAAETQAVMGEPVFSLIHATRGRPAQASECRNHWLNLAANPERIQHIFCVDADDAKSLRLGKQFEHVVSDRKSCVAAWNLGATAARGKILVQLSDDWLPVPGWDAKLLAEIENAGKATADEFVIAVSDGHRTDDLLCMAILSRARYERQGGEMFSDEYQSVFSDNEFSHRAFRDGVVIDARPRITFHHNHPAFGAAPMDATYAHNNQPERYKTGEATFRRRNPEVP